MIESLEEIKKYKYLEEISCKDIVEFYLNKNEIFKVIYSIDYEEKIKTISKFNQSIKNCIIVNKININQEKKYGYYSMKYLYDYKTLSKVLGKLSLKKKKIYCYKLIEAYLEIRKLNLVYYDFHEKNILVKNNDLLLIDLDSCLKLNKENEKLSLKYLTELIIVILYDFKMNFGIFSYLLKDEREKILHILYGEMYENDITLGLLCDYIENISKKEIKQKQKQISKKLLY